MRVFRTAVNLLLGWALVTALSVPVSAGAQSDDATRTTRVVGVVRDEMNAISLPGVLVEVVDTPQVAYTDVDGRYLLELPPGTHTIKIAIEGYNAETSSAAAQLLQRKHASVVDNQYVFVRGLGERYSNTTLAGCVLPTTEPDKKVVPLDLFPAGLIDSVQVAKSYSADKSAEFAGGLVQIVPLKFPNQPVVDFSYGLSYSSTATGKAIPLSSLGTRDWLGYDAGARALPGAFPNTKIVRQGIWCTARPC